MKTQQGTQENKAKEGKSGFLIEVPFENIALAFSGGGFRAASFALGVMSYLEQLKFDERTMLQHVSYLSSASGGTIATSLYSLFSSRQGDDHSGSFAGFYRELYSNLDGVKLLDRVFAILNDDNRWKDSLKRRNIINAFAIAYDELLFRSARIADIRRDNVHSGIEEVCFNATEFYRGLLFRQSIKLKDDGSKEPGFLYGNFIVHLGDTEAAGRMKLADLLAASSCFPAGFEPVIFPDDFAESPEHKHALIASLKVEPQSLDWDELILLFGRKRIDEMLHSFGTLPGPEIIAEEIKKLCFRQELRFGLMDGGIADNQGLESLMQAADRRTEGRTGFKPFDFMLVNDVGSHFMDPYQLPERKKVHSGIRNITIRTVKYIALGFAISGLAGIITGFSAFKSIGVSGSLILISTIVLILSGFVFTIIQFARWFIQGRIARDKGLNLEENFSENIVRHMFRYFGSTPVSVIWRMLKERISSVLILNNSVFLKRIRQLLYQRFFDSGKISDRVKSNHIYDLTFTNDLNRMARDSEKFTPGRRMQIVAESAFRMSTTLWFDERQKKSGKQADIVACGHFTTCYNLLEYIERLKKQNHPCLETYAERIKKLENMLAGHFEKFQKDPYWLVNELGAQHFTEWKPVVYSETIPEDFHGLRA